MLQFHSLTKQYDGNRAVDDVSFEVRPGEVSAFVGANGAGKTTTIRMLLGLVRPTSGTALVQGRLYASLATPSRTVGAVLDTGGIHPRRTARRHLRWLAAAGGIPRSRIDAVLDLVDLADAAGRPAGRFSLGMKQRLALAAALLGDPAVLVLDEPVNGLDPAGIRWLREFLRARAAEGRTVFVSSHLLGEMQSVADRALVIANGRLVADWDVRNFAGDGSLEQAYFDLTAQPAGGAA
jgi:ABC-2 type transport system ATP-binding protein